MPLSYRVCFADTDALGIVYHARYLEFAERSRNQALREAGVDTKELFRGGFGVALVLHRTAATYLAPAFADDMLELGTELRGHGPARFWWRTSIRREERLLCTVDAEVACVDLAKKHPALIPKRLLEAILGTAPSRPGGVEAVRREPDRAGAPEDHREDRVLVPTGP